MSKNTSLPSAEPVTATDYNDLTSSAVARADKIIAIMTDLCSNPTDQTAYLASCQAKFLHDCLKTQTAQAQPDNAASAATAYACAAHTVKVIADHATTFVNSLPVQELPNGDLAAHIPPRTAHADAILPVAADAALACDPASYERSYKAEHPTTQPPQNVHAYRHDDYIDVSWDPGPAGTIGYTVTAPLNGQNLDIAGGCLYSNEVRVTRESAYPLHLDRISSVQVTAYTETSQAASPHITVRRWY
jgi:hypothetical protein